MSAPIRKYAVRTLLAGSLLLNVAFVAQLAYSGSLRRVFLRRDLVGLSTDRKDFQKEMEARFRKFPNTAAEIVFAGDSLIYDGPWAEYFSEIHNRGIGGETTQGMMSRLDEILESRPRKIFLLLGTNDLSMAVPAVQTIRNYRALLERIRRDSPDTKVNVLAVTPVNSAFKTRFVYTNAQVKSLNEQLKALVAEFPGVGFVDLTSYLVDDNGELRREFTPDGGHLNYDAYLTLREPLGRLVAEDAPARSPEAKGHP